MAHSELRWHQGLESLQRALAQRQAALKALAGDSGNEVIGIAVIKAQEFSFALSWTTLKDLLGYEGIDALLPREVLRRFPKIRWVKLHGSRALGRHRPGSNIDLAFSCPQD